MTLDELLDEAFDDAKRVVVGTADQITARWVLVRPDDGLEIVVAPFRNQQEKLMATAMVRARIKEAGAVAYSFLSEVWMTHRGPGEDRGPAPMDSPDRVEAVMAIAATPTKTKMKSWTMRRDAAGNCVELIEYDNGGGKFSGRMAGGEMFGVRPQ